jgi:hypothetical protein
MASCRIYFCGKPRYSVRLYREVIQGVALGHLLTYLCLLGYQVSEQACVGFRLIKRAREHCIPKLLLLKMQYLPASHGVREVNACRGDG